MPNLRACTHDVRPPNGCEPSTDSIEHALPAARQLSFSKHWRPERIVQRERREETDELWRRLDDLVTDASDYPLPLEPCALSTSDPRARPCSRHCAHVFELMGLV